MPLSLATASAYIEDVHGSATFGADPCRLAPPAGRRVARHAWQARTVRAGSAFKPGGVDMRFHPDLHIRHLSDRFHRPRATHPTARFHAADEEAEAAKATVYISIVTLILLLVVLVAIAFGQEAMHWLGVR
jgi:hypothetical protein